MKKLTFWKSLFLLFALIVGTSSAWAAEGDVITSYANIESGKAYYIKGVYKSNKIDIDNYLNFTDAVSSGVLTTGVTTTANAKPVTFEKVSATTFYLITPNGYYITPHSSTNGYLVFSTTATAVTASDQSGKIRLSVGTKSIQQNQSSTRLGSYGNTQNDIVLVEAAPAAAVDVTLSFENTTPSTSLTKGTGSYDGSFTQTVSKSPAAYSGTVTYSITSLTGFTADEAEISSSTGEVTILSLTNKSGTIVVKAEGTAVEGKYNKPDDKTYTLTVNPYKPAAPTFSTEGGAIDYGTNLTLTSDFTIKYTTDGTEPTASVGTTYEAPIAIKDAMTIKAVAVDGGTVSDVASFDFTINTPADVTYSTPGGPSTNKVAVQYGTQITLSHAMAPSLGTIEYTLNGRIPKEKSESVVGQQTYSSPFTITDETRIKAIFLSDNEKYKSANYNDNYYIIATPDAPTPSETTGTEVAKNTVITLSHDLLEDNLGKIYYTETTDGTEPAEPTTASTEYTSGITINVDKKIKARFITNGNHLGEIAALEYSYIREDAGLAYSETNFESPISTSFTKPTLTNPHSLTITYSSSDETIATVNSETGDVTILNKEGEVTIYARSAKDATYYADEASYTITVYDPDRKGSQWNPFTVAEALTYIAAMTGEGDDLVSEDNYYTRAIVSQVGALNNDGTLYYYISDDGTTTNHFQVWEGKYLNNADFTNSNILQVGDEVVVCGKLENYSGTPYYYDNSYLTYFKRRLSADLAFGGETNKSVTLTQGDELTGVDFTKADGIDLADITFTASYNGVASVNSSGVITLGGSTGTSVITATFAQNDDYNAGKATCTITVNPAGVTPEPSATGYYEKVTSTSGLVDGGKYLIVNETKKFAFNGNLASGSLDGAKNYITYTVTDSKINSTDATQNAMVTLNAMENSKWSIKTKNDIYVGFTGTSGNGMTKADTPQENTITFSSNNVVIRGSGGVQLQCLNNNGSETFKYYSSSQLAVQLYKFVPGEAPANVDIYVSEAGYATYVSNFNLDYTTCDNLKAYIAKEESGEIKFTEVKKVPANTGVLLRATDGGGNKYTVNSTTAATDDMTGNKLVRGTGAAVPTGTNPYNYILNVVNNELGFYRANNQTVATNRAYLQTSVTPGALAKIAIIFDDATTSINALDNLTDSQLDNDAPIYNLAGQKVTKAYKGVVIQNGKKLVRK